MRTLLLTQRCPFPPDRGDRIRAYHLLRFLASRGEVDLACLADEQPQRETKAELSRLCKRVAIVPTAGRAARAARAAWSLGRGGSATEGHYYSAELVRVVSRWATTTRYDRVIAYCSSMYPYTRLTPLRLTPLVADLVDVDSQKWRDYSAKAPATKRWLYRLEAERVGQLENRILQDAEHVTVVTEAEQRLLDVPQAMLCKATTHAVPNGVAADYFRPKSDVVPTGDSCVFVGVLDYYPNVEGLAWFCEQVWPSVLRQRPNACFKIVGRNPNSTVRSLASRPGVELHADVPDVRPYLSKAKIAVAPLRIARGIQNKVLEAMAMAKPVVATFEALTGVHGAKQATIQAEAPEVWAEAILKLFDADQLRKKMGEAARATVLDQHDWDATWNRFAHIYAPLKGTDAEETETAMTPNKETATAC